MINSSKGLLKSHSSKLSILHRFIDATLIFFVLWLSNLFFKVEPTPYYGLAGFAAVFFFMFFAEFRSLYHSWRLDPIHREIYHVLIVWALVGCAIMILLFMTKTSEIFSRRVIVGWLIFTPVVLSLLRLFVRLWLHELRKRGKNSRSLAFAGACKQAHAISLKIENAPWMGFNVAGIYDDREQDRISSEACVLKGKLANLVESAHKGEIDYVYITMPMQAEKRIMQLIDALADTTASVCVVPDFFVFDLLHARWFNMGGIPVVSVFESPFFGVDGWLKRAEDLVLGSLILLLIALPMLLIAAAVKLSSSGPAIFRQRRYGLNGEVIEVWKFRSMSVCEDGDKVPQAHKHDPRVTRLGAILRRTSLDELPQFINVLQGSMSIVGPRPHAIAHNEQYRSQIHGYMLRHKIKPGITGWAQVNGWRGETDTLDKMQKRVEYDLEYIQNWSIWLDLKIVFLTVWRGFSGKNVY